MICLSCGRAAHSHCVLVECGFLYCPFCNSGFGFYVMELNIVCKSISLIYPGFYKSKMGQHLTTIFADEMFFCKADMNHVCYMLLTNKVNLNIKESQIIELKNGLKGDVVSDFQKTDLF